MDIRQSGSVEGWMAKLTVMSAPLPTAGVHRDAGCAWEEAAQCAQEKRLGMMTLAKDVTMVTVERHGSVCISRSYRTGWDF